VDALKPGNVHRFAGGHGMSYADFITSAELTAPILCRPGARVGERVLDAVRATRAAVSTNTNLGMLLLYAPVARAAERRSGALRDAIRRELQELDKIDAKQIFTAIREARPGGLGHVRRYDVNSDPDCTVQQAMAEAADRDLIARQYADGYEEIYAVGLPALRGLMARWNHVEWAAVGCYLRFLAGFQDSHILRKSGSEVAEGVRRRAAKVLGRFEMNNNPADAAAMLMEFDRELKEAQINPGTSADLTAASLLICRLEDQD
jgi:triphosphoribosyl-dephospho-CoA synthase